MLAYSRFNRCRDSILLWLHLCATRNRRRNTMKRFTTVVFAALVAVTLSMPVWAQNQAPSANSQTKTGEKQSKGEKKQATKAKKQEKKAKKQASKDAKKNSTNTSTK